MIFCQNVLFKIYFINIVKYLKFLLIYLCVVIIFIKFLKLMQKIKNKTIKNIIQQLRFLQDFLVCLDLSLYWY